MLVQVRWSCDAQDAEAQTMLCYPLSRNSDKPEFYYQCPAARTGSWILYPGGCQNGYDACQPGFADAISAIKANDSATCNFAQPVSQYVAQGAARLRAELQAHLQPVVDIISNLTWLAQHGMPAVGGVGWGGWTDGQVVGLGRCFSGRLGRWASGLGG